MKDEITGNESPVAKHVAQLVAKELRGVLDQLEQRVITGVLAGLGAWREEVDQERSSTRVRLAELEADLERLQRQVDGQQRELQNLADIVRGPDFAAYLEHSRAPTDRPPPDPEAA